MIDAEGAKLIAQHFDYVVKREKLLNDLALSLVIECSGRMYEVQEYLYKAEQEWKRLVEETYSEPNSSSAE